MLALSILLIVGWAVFAHSCNKKVKSGADDNELTEELKQDREKYVKKSGKQPTYTSFLTTPPKGALIKRILDTVIFAVVTCIMLVICAFAIFLNAKGQQFYLGNKAYITILTGSMSYKNEKNPNYDVLPDNQIEQYALITIETGGKYELYDVIAFNYGKTVFVHRIVKITERNGVKYYTTMGDANEGSAAFEKNITEDRIVGKFTGYKNLPLGKIICVLKSQVGISTLIAVAVFLFGADCALSSMNKTERERKLYLAIQLDEAAAGKQPAAATSAETQPAPVQAETVPQPVPIETVVQEQPAPVEPPAPTQTAETEHPAAVEAAPAPTETAETGEHPAQQTNRNSHKNSHPHSGNSHSHKNSSNKQHPHNAQE